MGRPSIAILGLLLSAAPAFVQSATITGHIVDTAGAPIAPSADPGSSSRAAAVVRDAVGTIVSTVLTGGTGGTSAFTIPNLTPGTYYVHTTNGFGYVNETADGYACVGGCALQGPIVLTAGAARNIEFVLDKGAVVSGTVRDAVTGAPIAGAGVLLYSATQSVVAQTISNAAGVYSIGGALAASTSLPIGSSLDPAGTFYWQPGPGFYGGYRFVFVRTSCDGARTRVPVTVTIK